MGSVSQVDEHTLATERMARLRVINRSLQSMSHRDLRMLKSDKSFVPGRGSMIPRMVFVGEAPGPTEDRERQPFCGKSGRFLNDLISSLGWKRSEVYVTNVVKWWPTNRTGHTRAPTDQEKIVCRPYLVRELATLEAWRVVALGRHASLSLVGQGFERGYWQQAPGLPFQVLPLYHPAAGLYQHSLKPTIFREFRQVLIGD